MNDASRTSGFRHEPSVGRSVEWYTPPAVFDALGLEFALDPASPPGGLPWVPASRFYSASDDGLSQSWNGRVWLNPPYGPGIDNWLDRLAEHGNGLALVFARTDTRWFQRAIQSAAAVCFIKGRIAFVSGQQGHSANPAPAPSVLLAYGLASALALTESRLGSVCLLPRERL